MLGAIMFICGVVFTLVLISLYAILRISSECARHEEEYRLKRKPNRKEYLRDYMREWRKKNREHYNEYQRNYQKEKKNGKK